MGQTIAENLVDPETGEILVEAGTEMTRDVIDSIAEYLDGDLNKLVYNTKRLCGGYRTCCSSKIQGCCTK